jgi:hypothetical protein
MGLEDRQTAPLEKDAWFKMGRMQCQTPRFYVTARNIVKICVGLGNYIIQIAQYCGQVAYQMMAGLAKYYHADILPWNFFVLPLLTSVWAMYCAMSHAFKYPYTLGTVFCQLHKPASLGPSVQNPCQ